MDNIRRIIEHNKQDMIQGHYDFLGVVVLVVSVAPGTPRSATRRVQHLHRVYECHIRT